jgi:creatinine amidohydrolase
VKLWGELTAAELGECAANGDVVLLPIGAVEQHGPGLSGAHKGFPGLLTLRMETFLMLLEDLCDSMVDDGFKKIVLVVGHGSNKPPIQMFVAQYAQRRNVNLLQLNYLNLGSAAFQQLRKTEPGGDFHAGEAETALMLHLAPQLVKMDRAVARPVNAKEHFGLTSAPSDIFKAGEAVVGFDLKAKFPEGVMGDPLPATAETGKAMFEQSVAKLVEIVDEFHEL